MKKRKSFIQKLYYALSRSFILLLLLIIGFYVYNNALINQQIAYTSRLNNQLYVEFYRNIKEKSLAFNNYLKILEKTNISQSDKQELQKTCLSQAEEGIERLDVAKAYDCLSRIEDLSSAVGIYKAIKNASYGLDVLFLKKNAKNLYNLIITGYENEILKILEAKNSDEIINKYFTGYTEDELPFLKKLFSLNIPDLSARSLYRLSLIHTLGRASFNEDYNPDFKLAYQELHQAALLSGIKQDNIMDIALVINDKFAKHVSTTIASALLNSNLDSFYRFHVIMNPMDPVSEESQKKLSSMNYIRDYSIEFTNFDNSILPTDLMKSKMKFSRYFPLLVNYRLYLDKIYPELDNILYIDSDMLVLRDLNYFKTLDMENYFAAATIDSGFFIRNNYIGDKKCNRLPPYFFKNSGLLFLELKNMRSFDTSYMLKKAINSYDCNFDLPDQDLLGLAFYDKMLHLPTRWNIQVTSPYAFAQFSYFIMHFAGPKPWTKEKEELWKKSPEKLNETTKDYWRYRQITPWAI